MPELEVKNVTKTFGGLIAVNAMNMKVCQGKLVGLIGPNGAGKTTLLNLISRIIPIDNGQILYDGIDLISLPLYRIISVGISRTFQIPIVFSGMTVLENVMVGAHCQSKAGILDVAIKTLRGRDGELTIREESIKSLEFFGLNSRMNDQAHNLSFGQIRLLELARALVAKPTLMLLDEPASGLTPAETQQLGQILRKIVNLGISILLVEHNVKMIMSVSDHVVVMNQGCLLCEGKPTEVQKDSNVIEAYLGRRHK
jgi:branched-chain amino acid transport system ATP-binding protein